MAAEFGLIGSPYSDSICLIKRAAQDRGYSAKFLSPLAFPRYSISTTSPNELLLDHTDLMDLDCFYIDLLEHRCGFFRGYFDKQTWISLQNRYEGFAKEEVENSAYQVSFLLTLGEIKPCINAPRTLLVTRLRPPTLVRLKSAGIPVADFTIVQSDINQSEWQSQADSLRIRIEEERCYDVPCFPRELVTCPRIEIAKTGKTWQAVCVVGCACNYAIEKEDMVQSRVVQSEDMRRICQSVLNALGLDVASIELGRFDNQLKVLDVNPFPDLSLFEAVTQEPISQVIVDRMIERSC